MKKQQHIAYKGFDKDLSCRGEKFLIDVPNKKKVLQDKLRLCSEDGWHYCDNLLDVFRFYPEKKENRFCEIEVLGNFESDKEKSITDHFRIIRELSKDDISNIKATMKVKQTCVGLGLPLIQKLQTEYPLMQIGGSVGLFLHGISLKRIISNPLSCDIDVIFPYYHKIDSDKFKVDASEERVSGSDFGEVLYIENKKFDIRVCPNQRYEIIKYEGVNYRVTLLESIMEAKFRYAMKGQFKHKHDVYEICGKNLAK